ncbi:DNA cytosine methyltransferase [Paenibacillus sp. MMO-58]|uniref:DNA cytosine methyltransferase n=1 Tax=Paenibacillus sp. MMO-58 TaxID=3081290 RepID=UPI00301AC935
MKALSLFSGIGGIDLACEWAGIETVAFCEREPFPQKVLRKHWPDIPIYDDVCTLTKERLEADGIGSIELIHGGYPCQPFSHAGKRKGKEDDRHLWPEVRRLIETIRPRWFVGENVAGHVTLGLDDVLSDLGELGYTAQPFVIPACAVNAPHRRDRVFIVAYSSGIGWNNRSHNREERYIQGDINWDAAESESEWDGRISGAGEISTTSPDASSTGLSIGGRSEWTEGSEKTRARLESEPERCSEDVANAESQRCRKEGEYQPQRTEEWPSSSSEDVPDSPSFRQQRQRELIQSFDTKTDRIWEASESLDVRVRNQWSAEPEVGRVANGVPNRVDRLKSLGNAVVPQQIYPIFAAIMEIEKAKEAQK